ncbi:amidohydrolase family protein [Parafrankia sp. BMG5.11]|uniref:amidohydrolase family protein n=2 Tax=unclassified Parafrankia TaxID=2994368 RepID=UPI00103FB16D|nr:amidohydrolase family protein [Parafrankia sp. BMG5.11]TCJ34016.1 amidohydrolase [Parafrankia sp. BMG5.11]
MLVRRAEAVLGRGGRPAGGLVDVRIGGGVVTEIGPPGQRLARQRGEDELDAVGGALLPGLHDHHIHLMSLAAAASSVVLGPPEITGPRDFANRLRTAAAAARAGTAGGWLRGVGYHPAVAGDLDRVALDALTGDVPARVQHRGGALWVLNSAGLRAVGLGPESFLDVEGVERTPDAVPTGRLWRLDGWLAGRVPRVPADLGAVGRAALAVGVTGFTDATPQRRPSDAAALADAVASGTLPQRLTLMRPLDGGPALPDGISPGPVKIMLDDTNLPPPDALAERVRWAHRAGASVAVHCVTRVQLVVALAAIGDAGPPPPGTADRIEHGAVVPPELAALVGAAGLTVVTQPNFVAERGDAYLAEVDPDDLDWLYPCRSLLAAGIAVAAGTDAPFGHPDPWRAIRAARERRTASGRVLGGGERVDGRTALDLFLGRPGDPARPRRLHPGLPADLCLLRTPLDDALADPDAAHVAATIIDGALAHTAP